MSLSKKIITFLLAVTMVLSVAACGDPQKETVPQTQGQKPSSTHVQQPTGTQGENAPTMPEENISDGLKDVVDMLLERSAVPAYGSIGGEWMAMGLSRLSPQAYSQWLEDYYQALEAHVAECDGVLNKRKYTEYSRVILAVTAIGKDPTNVSGYNLLIPLADYEQTVYQGINGAVFALLALDSGNYLIPENVKNSTQATREAYVDYILKEQLPEGGWSLAGGEPEVDITAMALQALAKYRQRQNVSEAIEKALQILSETQNAEAGYTAYRVDSSESVAQVIVALTELGISMDDERFVKNGKTLEDRLLDFQAENGGFEHLLGKGTDPVATEQAFYALVALHRQKMGMSSLYDMSDVK